MTIRSARVARIPMFWPLLLASAQWAQGAPLGSSFTYQGQIKDAGQPANGLYDLQVCLFDDPANPVALSCVANLDDVPVADGTFAVALDFGNAAFAGELRYLELRVRPGASTGAYTILNPRQQVRATPEALRAAVSSAAPWSGLTGVPAGFADGVDNAGSGTVTSIATGTGLTGGPITGNGTIAIATGGVGAAQIAVGAVDGARIADGSVQGTDIEAEALGPGQIAANAITASELANNAVDTAAIVDSNVTSAKIAAGAVGLAQINPAQVQARVGGSCVLGTYLRGINADGTALCAEVPGISAITVVDDPANAVGQFTAIAIGGDGLPVISYYDSTAGALRVAKCANAACTGAATITTVDDPANNVGGFSSLAIGSDGLPVIGYRDASAGALKVAKCANAACSGAATVTTVDDPANAVGAYISLAVGSDNVPVISYHDLTATALKVARCANAACTGMATITTVDDPANGVGAFSSIAIGSDGLPVVSYHDLTAGALKVAKCVDAACTGAATITTVDDPANIVGWDTSIAIGADGLPVIGYYDSTADALKVAKCANGACTGAAIITTVDDPTSDVGSFNSLAIGSDGLPVVAYWDLTAGALRVAKCADAACAGAATIATVDDPDSSVGLHVAIVVGVDGLPVISYFDQTASTLKVAKCGSRSCR